MKKDRMKNMIFTFSKTYVGKMSFLNHATGKDILLKGITARVINSAEHGHRVEIIFKNCSVDYRFWAAKKPDGSWSGKFYSTYTSYNQLKHFVSGVSDGYEVNDLTFSEEGGKLTVTCQWVEQSQVWPMMYDGEIVSDNQFEENDL